LNTDDPRYQAKFASDRLIGVQIAP